METQDQDIVAKVAKAGNFTKLHNAMKAADVVRTYEGLGPFTIFAPTDEAFAKLPSGQLELLLKDKGRLASILDFHVIRGAALAEDLQARDPRSLQGQSLTIALAANDDGFTVNGARISKREIEASNGLIYAIDTVMMPDAD
jgi:uncharacterized surface protein with fasciclin (FAS1) repeats